MIPGQKTAPITQCMIEDYYYYGEDSYASSWAEFEVSGNAITITVKYMDTNGEVKNYYTWGMIKN